MESRNSHILSFLETKTAEYADRIAVGMKSSYGWSEMTYKGVGLLSRKLARHLIEDLEIKKGECLAILSESKPQYAPCVFASVLTGTITVPLDIKLSKYELKSILTDCQPTVLICSQHYLDTALYLQKEVPSIQHILINDEHANHGDIKNIYELPDKYDAKWRQRSSKSTALIIYTSGTTGAPKGVEISFANVNAQLEDLTYAINLILPKNQKTTMLSILPMNHLFELTVGFSTFLFKGMTIYYTQSLKPKDILMIMREKKVNFMVVVPAFLKLLKAGIENEINANPKRKLIFSLIYNTAKFIPFKSIRKMIFKPIHDKFGGEFKGCISGGAPIDKNVANFFETIGLDIYAGYGLSETSPVVSVNYDKRRDYTSVGKPLSSFECRIDKETGEIQLKGPSVMKGYHNQPELTAETIDEDGWLHTGDVGHLDADGHIHITGRIKNMIVLSGGKKVFPEEVEAVLEKSDNFAEVCIMGSARTGGEKDGTEDIAAVIVPKEQFMKEKSDEELNKLVREEVKALSQQLAPYKRPINIVVHKEPLPKTTTLKVKRKEVKALLNL